jgi:N-sulfoglucosamine sulfohydrolase
MNFLFMTADDMNGSMPGWMGNPLKPTPNMDAFAVTAHRFTDNHDAAPICRPSREAMMTGLWPQRSGALGFNPINEGVPTLATVLKGKGYFIAALNKLEHMRNMRDPRRPWPRLNNESRVVGEEGEQLATEVPSTMLPGKLRRNR